MAIEFLSDSVWPSCTNLGPASGKRYAAVAFLGVDAADLLSEWKRGDLVVCNAGTRTLRQGLTNPVAIEHLLERGVQVISNDALHAKVLVGPHSAVVGSMNASLNSARSLIEAAARFDDPSEVKAARRFVRRLAQESTNIDDAFLAMERRQFRPPGGGGGAKQGGSTRSRQRLHIVECEFDDPPAMVERTFQAHEKEVAESKGLKSKYFIDPSWGPERRYREGEWVLWLDGDDAFLQECLAVHRAAGRSKHFVFFFRAELKPRVRSMEKKLRPTAARLGFRLESGRTLRDQGVIQAVFDLYGHTLPQVYEP